MSEQTPWFLEEDGFFGPRYLVEYGDALPQEQTITEVDFIEKTLKLQPRASILDIPCGHGRHSVELAKRGYDVTGLEFNNFFLSEGQKAADAAGVSVQFKHGDMRKLDFDSTFDIALNLFTSMGYIDTDEEDLKFMAGVYRALRPGGQFLIDFVNQSWLIRNFKAKDWRELPDGSLLLVEREHINTQGRNLVRRTKIKDGVVGETTATFLRLYTAAELVSMARSVGFMLKESFGDFEGRSLTIDSDRAILLFEKD